MDKSPLPQNRTPLQPAAYRALPVGAVRPHGWLLDQLQIQAQGLTGHLDEFWPDVGSIAAGSAAPATTGSGHLTIAMGSCLWPTCSTTSG